MMGKLWRAIVSLTVYACVATLIAELIVAVLRRPRLAHRPSQAHPNAGRRPGHRPRGPAPAGWR